MNRTVTIAGRRVECKVKGIGDAGGLFGDDQKADCRRVKDTIHRRGRGQLTAIGADINQITIANICCVDRAGDLCILRVACFGIAAGAKIVIGCGGSTSGRIRRVLALPPRRRSRGCCCHKHIQSSKLCLASVKLPK